MDIQPQLYVWTDNYLNKRGPDYWLPFVINGIFIKSVTQKALKEGEFDGVNFSRSKVIQYSKDQMMTFERYFKRKLVEIVDQFECEIMETLEERSFCKTPYGLCKYFAICKSPTDLQNAIALTNYKQVVYDPMKFGIVGD